MFKIADEAYAVANADKNLKAEATGIIASNNQDGVAEWLYANAKQECSIMQRLDKDIKDKVFHRFYLLYGEEDYLKKIYKIGMTKAGP